MKRSQQISTEHLVGQRAGGRSIDIIIYTGVGVEKGGGAIGSKELIMTYKLQVPSRAARSEP
jgi:hypothetical protein